MMTALILGPAEGLLFLPLNGNAFPTETGDPLIIIVVMNLVLSG
jgi:hypothetical protein